MLQPNLATDRSHIIEIVCARIINHVVFTTHAEIGNHCILACNTQNMRFKQI